MADEYYSSDDEDRMRIAEIGRAIVQVPTASDSDSVHNDGGRVARLDFSTDEFTSEEDEPVYTARSTGRKKKQKVNMTPPEDLLDSTERKARKYSKKKYADRAIRELIRCNALSRIVYGDGHWRLAESHANLANGYLLLKGLSSQAHYHAGIAKDIMLSGVHNSSSTTEKARLHYVLIRIYFVLGRSLTMMKKYSEAEHHLIKAEKISHERNKLRDIDEYEQADIDIKIAIALGKLCMQQNKTALGASCFEKAIDLIRRNYGKDSPELIPVYQDLGRLEQSKGQHANHDRAIEMYLQAHSIATARYSGQSDEVGQAAHMLALAYAEADSEESEISAESYLDESLGIYQVVHGPHNSKTIEVQDDLCKLLLRTDRPEEAVTQLKTVIESKGVCYGDMSEEVADSYKLFGSIRLSEGKMDKALKHFKRCLSIQTALYGSKYIKTKNTQQTVDMLLQSPSLAAQNAKSKEGQLKSRPRFNATVGRSTPLGAQKPS